jgi:hypothetical protein
MLLPPEVPITSLGVGPLCWTWLTQFRISLQNQSGEVTNEVWIPGFKVVLQRLSKGNSGKIPQYTFEGNKTFNGISQRWR